MWKKCAQVGSKCVNKIGSFDCSCLNGYEGDGFTCNEINECDPNQTDLGSKCPANTICVNTPGSYECACAQGFEKNQWANCVGKRSFLFNRLLLLVNSSFKDIDECEKRVDECQVNSLCINTIGSYKCVCQDGFKGNGVYCQGKTAHKIWSKYINCVK